MNFFYGQWTFISASTACNDWTHQHSPDADHADTDYIFAFVRNHSMFIGFITSWYITEAMNRPQNHKPV